LPGSRRSASAALCEWAIAWSCRGRLRSGPTARAIPTPKCRRGGASRSSSRRCARRARARSTSFARACSWSIPQTARQSRGLRPLAAGLEVLQTLEEPGAAAALRGQDAHLPCDAEQVVARVVPAEQLAAELPLVDAVELDPRAGRSDVGRLPRAAHRRLEP